MNHQFEIIMPLAGHGQRFKDQGIQVPKPLVKVGDLPLFYLSLKSLSPIIQKSRITFIVCREDEIEEPVSRFLKDKINNFQIISLKSRTKGPAETILAAKNTIDQNLPMLSLDCDLSFECKEYFQYLLTKPQHTSGALCYFSSNNPRYSFIRTNQDDNVIEIAEKRAISDKALIGSYFFDKAFDLFSSLEKLPPQDGEPFLSHGIAQMLSEGHHFKAFPSTKYFSYGTPEELKESLQSK